jgi:hypothetical protein
VPGNSALALSGPSGRPDFCAPRRAYGRCESSSRPQKGRPHVQRAISYHDRRPTARTTPHGRRRVCGGAPLRAPGGRGRDLPSRPGGEGNRLRLVARAGRRRRDVPRHAATQGHAVTGTQAMNTASATTTGLEPLPRRGSSKRCRKPAAPRDLELLVAVAKVGLDRLHGHEQPLGDLAVCHPLRREFCDP